MKNRFIQKHNTSYRELDKSPAAKILSHLMTENEGLIT